MIDIEIILSLLVGLVIIATVVMYNKIISGMNRSKRAWSDVITYEKLKIDLLPQLSTITDDFKDFESGFIEKVTTLREAISTLDNNKIDHKALSKAEELSSNVVTSIKATAENYPELGSTKLFQELMSQIADKSENVTAAITIYNRGVEQFNNSIEMIPLNFVNFVFARKNKLDTFVQSGTVESYDYKPNFT